MKKNVFIVLACLIFVNGYSQDENIELPNFTPPSPSAYELGKFGEFPVGMFTGASQSSIPLMEFKTKSISIPISLSYNSNGIKVDQLATKVGLGWNLIAGGAITRTVNQNPDELRTTAPPQNSSNDYETIPWLDYFNVLSLQLPGSSQSLVIDGEPDIFSFNFLGRSGKFTFQNQSQLEIILLDNISLKIEYNPEGNNGFLIIDENGVKYYFADAENSRMDAINGQSNTIGWYMATSWNLTRIETLIGEVINFEYTNENYSYVTTQSQYLTLPSDALNPSGGGLCNPSYASPEESPVTNHWLFMEGKRLSRISSNNAIHGEVNFQYTIAHPEVSNYSLLSSVILTNETSTVIEDVDLNYSNLNQRLFLNSVNFINPEKKYDFEYKNPSQIPQRLSMSKDHWGYYNGKANTKLYSDLSAVNNPYGSRFAALFPNGANKEIDEEKAKNGLLTKIIYPTKGYTEIEYESNTYNEFEEVESLESVNMSVLTNLSDPLFQEKSITIDLTDVSKSEMVPLTILFGINYQSCSQGPHPDVEDRELFITVENLTYTSHPAIIHSVNSQYGDVQIVGNGTGMTVTENDASNNQYLFNLIANNDYRITISVFYQCLSGELRFNYANAPSQFSFMNEKTGGLRVAKTVNKNDTNEILSLKKYHYASKDDLTKSSGYKGYDPYYFSYFTVVGSCNPEITGPSLCVPWKVDYIRLNSGSLRSLYRSSTQNTRYQYVTVSEDASDFTKGGVEYRYKISNAVSQPGFLYGTPAEVLSEGQKDWGDGYELQKNYFKLDGTTFKNVSQEINGYVRDSRINDVIIGYKTSRKYNLPCRGYTTTDILEQEIEKAQDELNVTQYNLTSNWVYLSSKSNVVYDTNGENPIETVVYYEYNIENSLVSEVRTTDSNDNEYKTKNYYPNDVTDASNLNDLGELLTTVEYNAIDQLKKVKNNGQEGDYKSATLIQVEKYKNSSLLATQRTNFVTNTLTLPSNIESSKGSANLEKRVAFHAYDVYGNPLEVYKEDGSHISYIWGYNRQYPVAKIENATYSEIAVAMAIPVSELETYNENHLNQINALRTSLPTAMVTTYIHEPLVGLKYVFDPRGRTTSYVYDSFNRLKEVRDHDNNLVSTNEYNYKN